MEGIVFSYCMQVSVLKYFYRHKRHQSSCFRSSVINYLISVFSLADHTSFRFGSIITLTHRGVTDILLMSGPLCVTDLNLAQMNDTVGIVTSWRPPAEEPVISGEKQSNLLSPHPDTHMQHLIYFMVLVWTLTLSGKLVVCTKWRFRAWNKPTADTNNMVLMCHKLYLSALFQTQCVHPASCWEGGGLLAQWPRHFWMNSDWSFVQRVLPDMKAYFTGNTVSQWQTTITQFCSSKFHHPQPSGY